VSSHLDGEVLLSPACFQLSPNDATKPRIEGVRLSAGSAGALAELLQVFSCGEESAALTFDHLGSSWREHSPRSALAGIVGEGLGLKVAVTCVRDFSFT